MITEITYQSAKHLPQRRARVSYVAARNWRVQLEAWRIVDVTTTYRELQKTRVRRAKSLTSAQGMARRFVGDA